MWLYYIIKIVVIVGMLRKVVIEILIEVIRSNCRGCPLEGSLELTLEA